MQGQQFSPAKSIPDIQPQNVASTPNLGSPVLLEEVDSFPHSITVEGVLSWPLWADQFEANSDLKRLLAIGHHEFFSPAVGNTALESDFVDEERLIQNYFQTFHIFNPVLDEQKIAEYRRSVQLNGYGMDTKSCLLVQPALMCFDLILTMPSFLCMLSGTLLNSMVPRP